MSPLLVNYQFISDFFVNCILFYSIIPETELNTNVIRLKTVEYETQSVMLLIKM